MREVVASITIPRKPGTERLVDMLQHKVYEAERKYLESLGWLLEGRCIWRGCRDACKCSEEYEVPE